MANYNGFSMKALKIKVLAGDRKQPRSVVGLFGRFVASAAMGLLGRPKTDSHLNEAVLSLDVTMSAVGLQFGGVGRSCAMG